jgi:hypothetical protein
MDRLKAIIPAAPQRSSLKIRIDISIHVGFCVWEEVAGICTFFYKIIRPNHKGTGLELFCRQQRKGMSLYKRQQKISTT